MTEGGSTTDGGKAGEERFGEEPALKPHAITCQRHGGGYARIIDSGAGIIDSRAGIIDFSAGIYDSSAGIIHSGGGIYDSGA